MKLFDDSGLAWEDLRWLWSVTGMPIMLKGILRPGDDTSALGLGGVIAPYHGGRQMDGCVAAVDALVSICYEAPQRARPARSRHPVRLGGVKAMTLGDRSSGRPTLCLRPGHSAGRCSPTRWSATCLQKVTASWPVGLPARGRPRPAMITPRTG